MSLCLCSHGVSVLPKINHLLFNNLSCKSELLADQPDLLLVVMANATVNEFEYDLLEVVDVLKRVERDADSQELTAKLVNPLNDVE